MTTQLLPDTNINTTVKIDATGLSHRQMNARLREVVAAGAEEIDLVNVCGQRYIGTDLNKCVKINIWGTPGGDLGSIMKGQIITVYGNAQDGTGNTMDDGLIVVHGHAGDITGLAARGGKIFIRDGVGYRTGIHMKAHEHKQPAIVIGDTAQDFLGEYMAGGVIAILGMNIGEEGYHQAHFIGTGMHGGVIYMRGKLHDYQLGKEVGIAPLDDTDVTTLGALVNEYATHFNCSANDIMSSEFIKLYPKHLRPYGNLYAY